MEAINENTDLNAAWAELERDRAALQAREYAIGIEGRRRDTAALKIAEVQAEAPYRAAKEVKTKQHAELVLQCRKAKDALAAHEVTVVRLQREMEIARAEVDRVAYRVTSHVPLDPNDFPLPSEREAWQQKRTELQAEAIRAQAPLTAAITALQAAQAERDAAAEQLREMAAQEWRLRAELGL